MVGGGAGFTADIWLTENLACPLPNLTQPLYQPSVSLLLGNVTTCFGRSCQQLLDTHLPRPAAGSSFSAASTLQTRPSWSRVMDSLASASLFCLEEATTAQLRCENNFKIKSNIRSIFQPWSSLEVIKPRLWSLRYLVWIKVRWNKL